MFQNWSLLAVAARHVFDLNVVASVQCISFLGM